MTLTGFIGWVCWFPLRLIIGMCVALRIHPNIITFSGVLINAGAAWELAHGRFISAGVIMILANIPDFIDGKVAVALNEVSQFGGFWDSVIDRFSDLSLFIGLIYLYSQLGRTDYAMVTALAMMFAIMTSYTRARAESLIAKCKVGFMERPERIVLFWIGAFTNRMAAVMWVIFVLSIFTVADRIILTYRELRVAEQRPIRKTLPVPLMILWNIFYWTYERATWQYDLMVIAILSFVWLTPPGWLGDPVAHGDGLIGWLLGRL
jgi:CDP-diacylglycerol--glycerol-3-phosphate 3-phosphatidyltransferase